jgi:hypothetical protein
VEFNPNIWHIADQMSDEVMQPEPVFDEFILAKWAEAAEYEDRRIRAVNALKELRAEADERDRTQADARFAEARRQHPHLSVHQIAAMLDDGREPEQYVDAVFQINAIES